eukprot:GFYU01014217.1.p1 GENE.GFYU01014217.1~~GFYU01014217.1.p1  ORF type:complete len:302 (+),score=40.90 GFYU01014217.1:253-1158(+)
MATERVYIPVSPDINLEAVIGWDTSVQSRTPGEPACVVIICHPHSALGGSMEDHVVRTVFDKLMQHPGITTVRFNFRGVGESGGSKSFRGHSEQEDVYSVVKYMRTTAPPKSLSSISERDRASSGGSTLPQLQEELACPPRIVLVGYSFGAIVSGASVVSIHEGRDDSHSFQFPRDAGRTICGYVAIGYPMGMMAQVGLMHRGRMQEVLSHKALPKLFVCGDRDDFTSWETLENKVRAERLKDSAAAANIACTKVHDSNHFFTTHHGLETLVDVVLDWVVNTFEKALKPIRSEANSSNPKM